jgi:hypothetical protein
MGSRIGISKARDEDARINSMELDLAARDSPYFPDDREGVDRWGRERAGLLACGTGWHDVCPAYLEESCPGDANRGTRIEPSTVRVCNLDCGACGGGGRSETMAYCGWPKGRAFFDSAIAEMGGTLRMDRWSAPPSAPAPTFPSRYIPSVEWGVKTYLPEMDGDPPPVLSTTMKTAKPGKMPLRERLAGYEGMLIVNGLNRDDMLDDMWDDRRRLYRFCREADVDIMVTPQFSYYDSRQLCMATYNTNRIFQWYVECMEAGFPHVALDMPPYHRDWLVDEYLDFIKRNKVKLISISYQTFRGEMGLDPRQIMNARRRLHRELDPDVAILVYGLGSAQGWVIVATSFPGRQVVFSNTSPFSRANFFKLLPADASAPPGMTKGQVFERNVNWMTRHVDTIIRRSLRAHEAAQEAGPRTRRGTRPRRRVQ